jgi:hypothetical protein
MPTPKFDAIVNKTRDYINKPDAATVPDSIIKDSLKYAADECYRLLRIPPLEYTVTYTVTAEDNSGENSLGLPYGNAYTSFVIPNNLITFNYIRTLAESNAETPYSTFPSNISKVFNEITDKRTFFDAYSEKYSVYNWMWSDNKIFIHPQLAVGATIEINYYRRLPDLDALFAVIPVNYLTGLSDANQPYLSLTGVITDTPLYFAGTGVNLRVFVTLAEATAYGLTQPITTVTTKYYIGKEVPNWLRDENERLLIWGAVYNMGGYLFDDKMEARYGKKFMDVVESLNKEEKWRRASGGNVQMNFNGGGLI